MGYDTLIRLEVLVADCCASRTYQHAIPWPEFKRTHGRSIRTPHDIEILTSIRTYLSHVTPLTLLSTNTLPRRGEIHFKEPK